MEVLVEARKEYMNQMCIVMAPFMITVFEQLYEETVKRSKNKKVLATYQQLLKEVKHWNDTIIKEHADAVNASCSWFNDLMAAVFVCHTKILAAVKLSAGENKVSLKLPTNERFVHTCYVNAAKELYKDPYIYHEESNEYERDDKLFERFSKCINDTVKELVPIESILRANMYRGDENKDIDFTTDAEEAEDPDIDDEPEPEPELEPEPEPESGPQNVEAPQAALDTPDPDVEEYKEIPVEGKGIPQTNSDNDDDDVLFNDAPDGVKKP